MGRPRAAMDRTKSHHAIETVLERGASSELAPRREPRADPG